MASHVVGPLIITSEPLPDERITELDETAEWTYTMFEVIPPIVTYPTRLRWRDRHKKKYPPPPPEPRELGPSF